MTHAATSLPRQVLLVIIPLTVTALSLLSACASSPDPSAELAVEPAAVERATGPAAAEAPVEMAAARVNITRANSLQDPGKSPAEISGAAYITSQQAKTAIAIAKARRNDLAQADSQTARAQSNLARQQTADAEQRAHAAQAQAAKARGLAAAAQANATSAQQHAERLKQQPATLQSTQTERGMLVSLGDVLFEFNRAEPKPAAHVSPRKLSELLKQNTARQTLIEGPTDSIGSAASSPFLSRRRADAVGAALVGMGMASRRATAIGYDEAYPTADNATDTNQALDRRGAV